MDELHDTRRYPAPRLAGLRAHAAQRQQETYERLATAIQHIESRGESVSVQTIRAACGLDYTSYARSPAALALFRAHSTHLQTTRRRRGDPTSDTLSPSHDRLLHYTKRTLVKRLRDAMRYRQEGDQAYTRVLHACLERDARITALEARVAELEQYQGFVDDFRARVRRQEHGSNDPGI